MKKIELMACNQIQKVKAGHRFGSGLPCLASHDRTQTHNRHKPRLRLVKTLQLMTPSLSFPSPSPLCSLFLSLSPSPLGLLRCDPSLFSFPPPFISLPFSYPLAGLFLLPLSHAFPIPPFPFPFPFALSPFLLA
ncbi:hypothetical protein IE53DRAFT_54312 [Violaceomyces palustris]|uniref:Uncharacterized protein n=1 Tax=Violaceomyces palustris TaxID=1673888 RepID=A0ACD0P7Q4_9BASI|nr:hypothetical protein IE53DRAFT_54312 [Violaceomyces palustris]